MLQNDFLAPILELHPAAVAAIIWLWGMGSLALVAVRTKTFPSILIKTPGIIVGDFFLLPAVGFLIALFYQSVDMPARFVTLPEWTIATALVALLFAATSAVRFKMISIWWVPHVIFYWFIAYIMLTFLTKGLYQLIAMEEGLGMWIIWTAVLLMLATHQVLGVIWSKKFPDII